MKMDIKIFEDQTGRMMFPEKRLDKTSSKNMNVVRLFDNKIDLYITSRKDGLEIICYLLVQRYQERAIGCYIIGNGQYADNTFTNFKNGANNTLKNMGLEHHYDDMENMVFDHIEEFDIDGKSHADIELIAEARDSGERVGYKAGDIGEIAILCRQILKRIDDIEIVISTVESNLGHVNILRSNTYEERLFPTNQGKQVLDRQRKKVAQRHIEEKRKLEEKSRLEEYEKRKLAEDEKRKLSEKIVDNSLEKGILLIEEGLDIKRKVGYDNVYIDYNIGIINDFINEKLSYFPPDKVEKNENKDVEGKIDNNEKIKKEEIGNDKIKEGASLVREAVISKRKAGYTDFEIGSNSRIKNSYITIRHYIPPEEDKKNTETGDGRKFLSISIVAIVLIIVGLLTTSWFLGFPFDPNNVTKNGQKITANEIDNVGSTFANIAETTVIPVQTSNNITNTTGSTTVTITIGVTESPTITNTINVSGMQTVMNANKVTGEPITTNIGNKKNNVSNTTGGTSNTTG
jgi:hypothetical protein